VTFWTDTLTSGLAPKPWTDEWGPVIRACLLGLAAGELAQGRAVGCGSTVVISFACLDCLFCEESRDIRATYLAAQ
jgi:hypothetical protein